jgi:hypothetical protein
MSQKILILDKSVIFCEQEQAGGQVELEGGAGQEVEVLVFEHWLCLGATRKLCVVGESCMNQNCQIWT